jgi:hypothetical protein
VLAAEASCKHVIRFLSDGIELTEKLIMNAIFTYLPDAPIAHYL